MSPAARTAEADGEPDLVVVGAGLFGLTVAETTARELGKRVLLIERRRHLGGNAWSEIDPQTGIEVHRYGSHLFHTSNEDVWRYVNRFTAFTRYEHRVFTVSGERVFPMPINLATICAFYGRHLTPAQARELIRSEAAPYAADGAGESLEQRALATIGPRLYDALVRGYTAKQWQTDPRELPGSVIGRLPVRYAFDTRYFDDTWQGLPVDGYAPWLKRMASSPLITVACGVDFFDVRRELPRVPLVYTGPLDRYFDCRAGALSWRTLDFERRTLPVPDHQGTAVLNYADVEVPWTRVHEFRHLHPERRHTQDCTVIAREYSRRAESGDEPYYPVNAPADRDRLLCYRSMAAAERDVFFGGRLGSYRYLDMHMAIASALRLVRNEIAPRLTPVLRRAAASSRGPGSGPVG